MNDRTSFACGLSPGLWRVERRRGSSEGDKDQEPNRIDLITRIDGVSFDEVWRGKLAGHLGDTAVWFISANDHGMYKRAAGRTRGHADTEQTEKLMGSLAG